MKLTGKQRYWQACLKARIRAQRNLREFMAGNIPVLPCSDPQPEIENELERAYAEGFKDGSLRNGEAV